LSHTQARFYIKNLVAEKVALPMEASLKNDEEEGSGVSRNDVGASLIVYRTKISDGYPSSGDVSEVSSVSAPNSRHYQNKTAEVNRASPFTF